MINPLYLSIYLFIYLPLRYVVPLVAMLFFESSIRRHSSQISPAKISDADQLGLTKGFGTSRTFLGLLTVRSLIRKIVP